MEGRSGSRLDIKNLSNEKSNGAEHLLGSPHQSLSDSPAPAPAKRDASLAGA